MENQSKNIVWLHRLVLKFLVEQATAKALLETGGVLMGYWGQSGNVPVILHATGPGPRATHSEGC